MCINVAKIETLHMREKVFEEQTQVDPLKNQALFLYGNVVDAKLPEPQQYVIFTNRWLRHGYSYFSGRTVNILQ
jgi:hypothetical protein